MTSSHEHGAHPVGNPTPDAPPSQREDDPSSSVVTVTTRVDWQRWAWLAATLGFVFATIWILSQVPAVSVPLFIAMGVAYVLHPVVDWMSAKGLGRSWAIALLGGLVASALIVGGAVVIPALVEQGKRLPKQLQDRVGEANPWLEATFGVHLPQTADAAFRLLSTGLSSLSTRLGEVLDETGSVFDAISGGTSSALSVVAGLLLAPVLTAYFLRHYFRICSWVENAIPRGNYPKVMAHLRAIDEALAGFLRGQGIVALILAVMYAIGFYLVDLPLALLVAVVSGLGNFVPYLGTAVGVVLATMIVVLYGRSWVDAVLVYAVFAVVQFVEGWFITPRVVGDRVGLSPVAVIFFVLLFGELFGFVGVLLAVPLTAVLKILFLSAFHRYQDSSLYSA